MSSFAFSRFFNRPPVLKSTPKPLRNSKEVYLGCVRTLKKSRYESDRFFSTSLTLSVSKALGPGAQIQPHRDTGCAAKLKNGGLT
jgi:hypothetical protein